jgi:hypothetical protein
MGQAHLATAFPAQLTEPFGLRPKQGSTEALDGGVDSCERRRGEVGPWVGEMAGEVGDSIWLPAKEKAHQRAVSMGARLDRRGMAVRAASGGGGRRLTAQEGGQDTGGRWGNVDGSRRWPEEAGASDTFTAKTDGGSTQGRSRMRPHSSGDEGGSSSRWCTRLQRRHLAWHSGREEATLSG